MPKEIDSRGIYFDSKLLGDPDYNYVAWLDVMGTANQMLRSLPISVNFIFKLQCAVLEAFEDLDVKDGVRLYPVMDGTYITSTRRTALQLVLTQALRRVANTFLAEPKTYHQFLVRGAIAFGPVFHGCDLDPKASFVMSRHEHIRNSMLMGLPMAQAYRAERDAPPFGIAVDASARAFAPLGDKPFPFVWYDWFKHSSPALDQTQMLAHLKEYFDYQQRFTNLSGYEVSRIEQHRKLATEFFTQ